MQTNAVRRVATVISWIAIVWSILVIVFYSGVIPNSEYLLSYFIGGIFGKLAFLAVNALGTLIIAGVAIGMNLVSRTNKILNLILIIELAALLIFIVASSSISTRGL